MFWRAVHWGSSAGRGWGAAPFLLGWRACTVYAVPLGAFGGALVVLTLVFGVGETGNTGGESCS